MDNYIGTKLIKAEEMTKAEFLFFAKKIDEKEAEQMKPELGYKVQYPDEYVSWSPKDVFEKAYMKVTPNSKLKSDISISQEMVDNFIKETHVNTVGDKTTLVRVVLRNGFELCATSSCVDKDNYDKKIGVEICMKMIKDKVWFLLGFLLQTAKSGVK